jgi:putative peptidoglycan lipid II flippase
MLATLFFSSAFDQGDVKMATMSLMAYAPGLMAIMLIKVLAPGFYGRQDTKTPVRIGIIAMSVNMVLNILLVFPLAHAGLALATTLSSGVNAYLLYDALRKGNIYTPTAGWGVLLFRALAASLAMAALLLWGTGDISQWLAVSGATRVSWLTGLIASAILVYFAMLFILGVRPSHFRGVKK